MTIKTKFTGTIKSIPVMIWEKIAIRAGLTTTSTPTFAALINAIKINSGRVKRNAFEKGFVVGEDEILVELELVFEITITKS